MQKIDDRLLNQVSQAAFEAPRRRINHNFHPQLSDPLQRMLNAIEPGSYIRPHKHENPDKVEAFVVLRGKLAVVEFEDDGAIADYAILEPRAGSYGAEIAARRFHTIVALEPTVVYEIKNGPYSPINDKNWAPWAPIEGEAQVPAYLDTILNKLV